MRLWFAITLFLSAALLFLVQPMVAKMMLPMLGGSPAVWNTCMVFFQAVLLLGYLYAHALPRWLGVRRHAAIHLAVLLLPLLALPIAVRGFVPPAEANPSLWVLGMLTVVVGLPFGALATSAPLLQRWFGDTGDPTGRDPYFLYAASNLGSMMALLAYPLLVEPNFRVADQSRLWSFGYGLLIAMAAGCVIFLLRSPPAEHTAPAAAPEGAKAGGDRMPEGRRAGGDAAPGALQRLRWVALAFVPSSLMLGVTSYLSTDIAAFPLLWVVPLALYLLSFIVVFAWPEGPVRRVSVLLLPVMVVLLILVRENLMGLPIGAIVAVHLLALLVAAIVCHGELARSRPAVRHLTEFYLWMSLGGVLGGAANALLAPRVFDRLVEYPAMIVLACLLQLGAARSGPSAATAAKARAKGRTARARPSAGPATSRRAGVSLAGVAWAVFGLAAGVYFLRQAYAGSDVIVRSERDFFGVHRVFTDPGRRFLMLGHGTTIHGMQSLDPALRGEPLSYFFPTGPIGQVFGAFSGPRAKPRVAVVGLGVGSMAAYFQPGQQLTYYEIAPTVERIARDTTLFTYLRDAERRGVDLRIVLGDARLRLARAEGDRYGLIVLDAFSSDAIPLHLITREAVRMYLDRLDPDGLLAFNISSKYFDLKPVVGALARDAGLVCVIQEDLSTTDDERRRGKVASRWALMARRREDFGALAGDPRWQEPPVVADRAWADDYSDLLGVIRWGGSARR